MRALNFGSINIDYVYNMPHFVRPGETLAANRRDIILGGKGANQSIALARAGADVLHLGSVNEVDTWTIDFLKENKVNVDHISISDRPSGHAIIQIDQSGENSIILFGGANQAISSSQIEQAVEDMSSGDWLLIQNECNSVNLAIEVAKKKGMKIAFNPAPMNESVKTLPIRDVDLLFVNEIESAELADAQHQTEILSALQKRYPQTTIVQTLGDRGAIVSKNGCHFQKPAKQVQVCDTTAAGDTFVGYFLASVMKNETLESALEKAIAASAIAVTREGAAPSIPYNFEV